MVFDLAYKALNKRDMLKYQGVHFYVLGMNCGKKGTLTLLLSTGLYESSLGANESPYSMNSPHMPRSGH